MTEETNKPIDEPVDPDKLEVANQAESADKVLPEGPEASSVDPPETVDDAQGQEAISGEGIAAQPEDGTTEEPQPEEPQPADTGDGTDAEEADSAAEVAEPEEEEPKMDWYILKVQSNREDSIRDGLLRRVKIAGLEEYFGEVIVPTEKVTEFKGGKKRVMKRKLYPGYLVIQMEINDDTWFLVRETPGIGDFTGAAGHPTPMLQHEVDRILAKKEEKQDEVPKLKIGFNAGDRVKINEGTFENFEGEVHAIDETNGRVTVMINIFGRSTPVELEYWQIENV